MGMSVRGVARQGKSCRGNRTKGHRPDAAEAVLDGIATQAKRGFSAQVQHNRGL